MPPPTGVVSGPLMPTMWSRKASTVSSESHDPVSLNASSPARTSCQSMRFLPPYDFSTAASKTRCDARQMSGPVPSPSMKGMVGSSGTVRWPWPSLVMTLMRPRLARRCDGKTGDGGRLGQASVVGDEPCNGVAQLERGGEMQRVERTKRRRVQSGGRRDHSVGPGVHVDACED